MNELGTALRELARDAAPTSADPAALWQAGRARVRRRRVAGVAVAAVVAVLVGSLAWVRSEPAVVMPAGEVHRAAIPKNVYAPNRFLAGVSKAGPPGRLSVIAALSGDQDHTFGAWFGISATTGEYRRLDLPSLADDVSLRLSPDGTRIAYWITGSTRKKDYGPPRGDSFGGPLPDKPITGVAVYDTRDGSVSRHSVPSDYGLTIDGMWTSLYWLDHDHLAFQYNTVLGTNSSMDAGVFVWDLKRDVVGRMPGRDVGTDTNFAPALPGDGALAGVDNRYTVVDGEGRSIGPTFRVPGGIGPYSVSLYGDRVVKSAHRIGDDLDIRLVTGRAREGRTVALAPVGTILNSVLVGWRSPTSVLVTAYEPGENTGEFRGLYVADLDTGVVDKVGGVSIDLETFSLQVADDLLSDPMVHGRKPPSVWSMVVTPAFIALGVLLAGSVAWFLVRRRRRA